MNSFLKNKKVAFLLVSFLFLLGVALFKQKDTRDREFFTLFSPIVISTDRALLDFGEIDDRYVKGQETQENYETAWYDLNYRLKIIKKHEEELPRVPEEFLGITDDFRKGFNLVLGVSNDNVDYYNGAITDPAIIINNRQKLEEGLTLLKQVKDRLSSKEKEI